MNIDNKSPPPELIPLMLLLALAFIVAGGWVITQWADMKGQYDEVLQHKGRDSRLP